MTQNLPSCSFPSPSGTTYSPYAELRKVLARSRDCGIPQHRHGGLGVNRLGIIEVVLLLQRSVEDDRES